MDNFRTIYDEVLYIDKVMPFSDLPKITDGYKKVFAVDPDFFDWNIPNNALDVPGLIAVCLDTTSFSYINLEYAKKKNIIVTNVRHYSTESVAEQGMAMALNIARKLPLLMQNKMEINYETMRGVELYGKTAGIIGLGQIGTRIAELCVGIGMKVCYWSRKSEDSRFEKASLDDLFKKSDVIFPALSKNGETENIITNQLLESMKSNAMFIEITENLLYNHKLLLDMAKNKRIYGYGFEETHPGNYAGNVLAIPPLAYYTKEAIDRNAAQWMECIIGIKTGEIKNSFA